MSPDITMCQDHNCPKADQCYRYMAEPNEYWQSYFMKSPRKGKRCASFIALVNNGNRLFPNKNHARTRDKRGGL